MAPLGAVPSVPAPTQAAAEPPFVSPAAEDFCGVMVTWCFRHGVFQAPRQDPETPPLWASLWVAGCQPNPEPLIPPGPTSCQATQLWVAEPLTSTDPGSQRLCSSSRLSSRLSPGVLPIIYITLDIKCLPSASPSSRKLVPPPLPCPRPASMNKGQFIGLAFLLGKEFKRRKARTR